MGAGSILLWLGIPYAWIWLASQAAGGEARLKVGPVMMIIAGIPMTMVLWAWVLARLNDLYYRATETPLPGGPQQAAWLRSMRGERGSARPRTVLDTVMVVSVVLALIAFELWYVLLAGSPLPSGTPLPGPG
jgi:hypothetical protein